VIAIGLDRVKNPINVGSILRTAQVFGAKMIAISGGRCKVTAPDTGKAFKRIPVVRTDDCILRSCPYGATPVVIEVGGAVELPRFFHPKQAFYIFGPEDGSVDREVLARTKNIVSIPAEFCLNLAQAVTVVLYDRRAKELTNNTIYTQRDFPSRPWKKRV